MRPILLLCVFILTGSSSLAQADFLSKSIHVWGVLVNGSSHFHVDHSGNYYITGAFEDSVYFSSTEDWIVPMDSTDFFMAKLNRDFVPAWWM